MTKMKKTYVGYPDNTYIAVTTEDKPREYDKGYQSGYDAGYKRAMLDYGLEDDNSCEDAVSKAIETIVNYCSERVCGNCHLFSPEGCIFKCGYPHEWLEVQEELKARRLKEEAANK